MSGELKTAIVNYYDFLTGYENLLRDGAVEATMNITSQQDGIELCKWAPQCGKVLNIIKKTADKDIIHLINFLDAVHLDWRDDSGTQTEPRQISDISLRIIPSRTPTKIWAASPDINGGLPQELEFKVSGSFVTFKVPELKYWTMIVVE